MSRILARCLTTAILLPSLTGSALAACDKADDIIQHAYPKATENGDSYEIDGKDYTHSINPDQIVCRAWPYRPELTLAVVPLIEQEPDVDSITRGDVELLALDTRSGAVVARYVEKGAADSDAMNFDGADLDVARYDVKQGQRAFGLRVTGSHSGSGFGFSQEVLSLYALDGHSITPLFKNLITVNSSGQDNGDCDSNHDELKRTLLVGAPGPGGYNDLIVQETHDEDSSSKVGSECKEDKQSSPRTVTLRFNGKTYAPAPGTPADKDGDTLFLERDADEPAKPSETAKPSFDCAKAASPVEKAICASPNISSADSAVNEAYRQLLGQFDPAGAAALKADQTAFVGMRDARFAWPRDDSAHRSMLKDELDLRAADLGKIDPAPPTGFAGSWTSLSSNATIKAKGGAYTFSLTTADPVTGGSMCQIEAEGTLSGDALVVDPGPKGWRVTAYRTGALLELFLEKPSWDVNAQPPFCAQGGKIGGVLFAKRAGQ
jgi:uncharacterized protein YecT (DUF1311 family)